MRACVPKPHVVGIGGSLREHSCSYLALEHAMASLVRLGCTTRIIDLRTLSLPFCNGEKHWPRSAYPGVSELRTALSDAHAVVFATPEYHGSVSGVLKNTLDLLDVEQLKGKAVGAISVLGGPANSNALNDLSRMMRWFHAWVIPEQIAIGYASSAFAAGRLSDTDLLDRFERFAESLVDVANRLYAGNDTASLSRQKTTA